MTTTRVTTPAPPRRAPRAAVGVAAVVGSAVVLLAPGLQLNGGGWVVAGRFFAAAARPDLSAAYLGAVLEASLVTLAYAVLGTVASVVLGLGGGLLLSRTWWRGRAGGRTGRAAGRLAAVVPRGIHEMVWGLVLVVLLGPVPLAAVVAIAVPYGAITAKVCADLLDGLPPDTYDTLRAGGAGRLAAVAYGLAPRLLPDLVSYALYRFDCAIRSAVILGIVGAGGIGLLLDGAFQDLAYERLWTCVYALVALCALGDVVSHRLRRGLRDDGVSVPVRRAVLGVVAATVAAWAYLGVDLGVAASTRVAREASFLLGQAWPPRLPAGGVGQLVTATVETAAMSVVAIAVAALIAFPAAPLLARRHGARRGGEAAWARAGGVAGRGVLLLLRAVPSPVWALVILFLVRPGPLVGALALGLYNAGVLGRLAAEAVEDLDPGPERVLRAQGAGPFVAAAYAAAPRALPQAGAYAVYRWEVAARETVVVGLVGGGGLGYLLMRQLAAFDWAAMAMSLAALVALTCVVDVVGGRLGRRLPAARG